MRKRYKNTAKTKLREKKYNDETNVLCIFDMQERNFPKIGPTKISRI